MMHYKSCLKSTPGNGSELLGPPKVTYTMMIVPVLRERVLHIKCRQFNTQSLTLKHMVVSRWLTSLFVQRQGRYCLGEQLQPCRYCLGERLQQCQDFILRDQPIQPAKLSLGWPEELQQEEFISPKCLLLRRSYVDDSRKAKRTALIRSY